MMVRATVYCRVSGVFVRFVYRRVVWGTFVAPLALQFRGRN